MYVLIDFRVVRAKLSAANVNSPVRIEIIHFTDETNNKLSWSRDLAVGYT